MSEAPQVEGVVRQPEGAHIAFLLIHGFGAHVDELATLGDYLFEERIASFSVSLAGHGTTPEDLERTDRDDWYKSAIKGLDTIISWDPEFIFVAGLSMGGLLALKLAANSDNIDGIVVLSPAIKFGGFKVKLIPILKRLIRYRRVDLSKMTQMYDVPRFKYEKDPIASIDQLVKLSREVRKQLKRVTSPLLVLQAGEDKTIDVNSGKIAYDSVSSAIKELHTISDSEHVITCHPARHQAYPVIVEFVKKVTALRSS